MAYALGSGTDNFSCHVFVSLTDYNFAYDHFQETQQLAQREGEMVIFIVDIRCHACNSIIACNLTITLTISMLCTHKDRDVHIHFTLAGTIDVISDSDIPRAM